MRPRCPGRAGKEEVARRGSRCLAAAPALRARRGGFLLLPGPGGAPEGGMQRGRGGRGGGARLAQGWGMHKGRKRARRSQADPRSAARWGPLAWKCCKENRREGRGRRGETGLLRLLLLRLCLLLSAQPCRGQRGGRGAAGSGAWGVGVGLTRAARTRSCLAVSLLCPSRLGGVSGAGLAVGMPCAWPCRGLHGDLGQLSGPLSGGVSVVSAFLGLCGLFFKKIIHRPLSWGCKRGHPIQTAPHHHLNVVFLQPYVVLHSDGKSVPLMQVPL